MVDRGPFRDPQLRNIVAPRIETDRLTLRHVRAEDADFFAEVYGDEELSRHLGGVRGREDAWRRGVTGAGFWGTLGIGLWMVDSKATDRTLGYVGFFDFQREIDPSIGGEPEMGWIFHHDGQGQGYATEAARAALSWLDATFGPISVPAIIGLENHASMRLAERLGFVRQADASYRGEALALFRREPR